MIPTAICDRPGGAYGHTVFWKNIACDRQQLYASLHADGCSVPEEVKYAVHIDRAREKNTGRSGPARPLADRGITLENKNGDGVSTVPAHARPLEATSNTSDSGDR